MAAAALGGQGSWNALPPTPKLPEPDQVTWVEVGGARLFCAGFGAGPPVLLLHGGGAHSGYWGDVIPLLAPHALVLALDTRGHGRSTLGAGGLSYPRIADDAVAVLAQLGLGAAALVGWSDGGIAGLDLAMRAPERLTRLFTFGANVNRAGGRPDARAHTTVLAFEARFAPEYASLAPYPADFARLQLALRQMWRTGPNYAWDRVRGIRVPTTVSDGEYDEYIRPEHTRSIAAAIPGARLLIQPGVSHFAMLQQPHAFAAEVLEFLRA
jgi:pimeloyl-ACP methyl ester carboxylesterase